MNPNGDRQPGIARAPSTASASAVTIGGRTDRHCCGVDSAIAASRSRLRPSRPVTAARSASRSGTWTTCGVSPRARIRSTAASTASPAVRARVPAVQTTVASVVKPTATVGRRSQTTWQSGQRSWSMSACRSSRSLPGLSSSIVTRRPGGTSSDAATPQCGQRGLAGSVTVATPRRGGSRRATPPTPRSPPAWSSWSSRCGHG